MNHYKKNIEEYIIFHLEIIKELFSIEKKQLTILIILTCIIPISTYVELYYSKYIVDAVAYWNVNDNHILAKIVLSACLICLLIIVLKFLDIIYNLVNNRYSKKVITTKKEIFINAIEKKSFENFEDFDFYQEIYVACKAPEQYANAVFHISGIINIIVNFIVYMIVICRVKLYFGILLVLVLIEYIYINKNTANRWDDYFEKNIIPEQRRCNYFEQILCDRINHSNIQINRQLKFFAKNYETYADKERKSTLKMNALAFWTELKLSLGYVIISFVILVVLAQKIIYREVSIGEFTMICNALFQLFFLYKSFTQYIYSDKEYIRTIKSYKFIVNSYDKEEQIKCENKSCIDIVNLEYKYKQAENFSLNLINATFKSGEKIAVVGANGSGKTTLILNIMNLLMPTNGTITNSIGNIAAITQDFQSYQLTIKENIELGVGGKILTENEIKELLKKVNLMEFVNGLEKGIYTQLGQLNNGVELSKGQMQRLALARLLANEEAKVWILDEPTAYLDPISEIDVYNEILELSGDRTVFFISHRLGFAKKADRIIVLDNGKIVENGNHMSLIKNESSIYRKMYESQLEWYKE